MDGEKAQSVEFAPQGSVHAFDTPNCDAWVIHNVASFEAFVQVYDEKSALAPEHHLFASFDDYDQACYTSGHAMGKYDLDPPYEKDEGDSGAGLVEVIKHDGHFSTNSNFATIFEKFIDQTGSLNFSQLAGRLRWNIGNEYRPNLQDLNASPSQCLDARIVMQIVPVRVPEDALCAFPNGYFSDDLTPFENHALAAYLRHNYGYRLIAIGANYVCFLRDSPLNDLLAQALSSEIAGLHEGASQNASSAIKHLLTKNRHLILYYVNR